MDQLYVELLMPWTLLCLVQKHGKWFVLHCQQLVASSIGSKEETVLTKNGVVRSVLIHT